MTQKQKKLFSVLFAFEILIAVTAFMLKRSYIHVFSQYPHFSEPEYVAEGRKYILLSGCESGSMSIKKGKTALWLLLWKGLTPDEKVKTKILVHSKVSKKKGS